MTEEATRARALALLRDMLGPDAEFREGQWEAIEAVAVRRGRALVVQRTGWGKSLVYIIATKLLRDSGAGPAVLISPLLSLMRNQVAMAERIGVRAARMDSANQDEWNEVEAGLAAGRIDILLVSPERLANERFRTQTLEAFGGRIGLLVVDEAHCISDWGHDFRPDYRRITRIVRNLPPGSPMLATTATANQRVVDDIQEQLGPGLLTFRGPLARRSLRIQAVRLGDQAERLAWLAQYLPTFPGSGIVYCLTKHDCERVSRWLALNGIDAPAYHANSDHGQRVDLEQRLLANRVKALVATVALGMGFDKPDLGFVVHYQRPGSVIAYYQQIGRAGRAVDDAYAVLLSGREDDDIADYFIRSAFPAVEQSRTVLTAIEEANDGVTPRDLLASVNLRKTKVDQVLKLLEIDGVVYRDEHGRYYRSPTPWQPDESRVARVTERRRAELDRMRDFVATPGCLMEFVTRELDDPHAGPCGRCANCAGLPVATDVGPAQVNEAIRFLRRSHVAIEPRRQWPAGLPSCRGNIRPAERMEPGLALSVYGDAGWGRLVSHGKFVQGRFGDELVEAAARLVIEEWRPTPKPTWVTAVPSLRRPTLVPDFARRLAAALGLPFHEALVKIRETREQKTMENSAQQAGNVVEAFAAREGELQPGPVLLVDDMVDSRWTLTVCARALRRAGCAAVFPFALASATAQDAG